MASPPPARPHALRFEYVLSYHSGCATLTDGRGRSAVTWQSTILGDGLWELADVVGALLQGAEQGTVRWQDEPGETRWVLARDGDALRVTVRGFAKNFSHRSDGEGGVPLRRPGAPGRLRGPGQESARRPAGDPRRRRLPDAHRVGVPEYPYERLVTRLRERKYRRRAT